MYDNSACDEAAGRYARRVGSRAIAVYRLDAEHTHAQGVKILVLVDRAALDNRYFFSPHERLPAAQAHLFANDPYILPAFSLRVMRHAPHANRTPIAGRDVLVPYTSAVDEDERACRALERRCAALPAGCAELAALQAALRGERTVPGLDPEYAFRRAREITGYRQDLASLGFPYGDIFSEAAFPHRVRAMAAAPVVERFARGFYSLRRRIENRAYA